MRRSEQKEMMDFPDNPKELLAGDLRNLQIINHYLGGYRSVLCGLDRLVGGGKLNRFSLLDVGTGSGDIPALIAEWARKKGISAELLALEAEPVIAATAAQETQHCPEIAVVRGDGMAPPFRPASFDFVLASQLLHHFSEDKIVSLLRIWSKVARKAIIVSDLVRHPVAYHGISVITKLFTRNVMTRTDAPLSVQRAFTIPEWRDLFRCADIGPVELLPVFPFRVLALLSLSGRT